MKQRSSAIAAVVAICCCISFNEAIKLQRVHHTPTHKVDLSNESRSTSLALTNALYRVQNGDGEESAEDLLNTDEIKKLHSTIQRWRQMEVKLRLALSPDSSHQMQTFQDVAHNIASARVLIAHLILEVTESTRYALDIDGGRKSSELESGRRMAAIMELEDACPLLWTYKSAWRSLEYLGWLDCYAMLGPYYQSIDHQEDLSSVKQKLLEAMPWIQDVVYKGPGHTTADTDADAAFTHGARTTSEDLSLEDISETGIVEGVESGEERRGGGQAEIDGLHLLVGLSLEERAVLAAELKGAWALADSIRSSFARLAESFMVSSSSDKDRALQYGRTKKAVDEVLQRFLLHGAAGARDPDANTITLTSLSWNLNQYAVGEEQSNNALHTSSRDTSSSSTSSTSSASTSSSGSSSGWAVDVPRLRARLLEELRRETDAFLAIMRGVIEHGETFVQALPGPDSFVAGRYNSIGFMSDGQIAAAFSAAADRVRRHEEQEEQEFRQSEQNRFVGGHGLRSLADTENDLEDDQWQDIPAMVGNNFAQRYKARAAAAAAGPSKAGDSDRDATSSRSHGNPNRSKKQGSPRQQSQQQHLQRRERKPRSSYETATPVEQSWGEALSSFSYWAVVSGLLCTATAALVGEGLRRSRPHHQLKRATAAVLPAFQLGGILSALGAALGYNYNNSTAAGAGAVGASVLTAGRETAGGAGGKASKPSRAAATRAAALVAIAERNKHRNTSTTSTKSATSASQCSSSTAHCRYGRQTENLDNPSSASVWIVVLCAFTARCSENVQITLAEAVVRSVALAAALCNFLVRSFQAALHSKAGEQCAAALSAGSTVLMSSVVAFASAGCPIAAGNAPGSAGGTGPAGLARESLDEAWMLSEAGSSTYKSGSKQVRNKHKQQSALRGKACSSRGGGSGGDRAHSSGMHTHASSRGGKYEQLQPLQCGQSKQCSAAVTPNSVTARVMSSDDEHRGPGVEGEREGEGGLRLPTFEEFAAQVPGGAGGDLGVGGDPALLHEYYEQHLHFLRSSQKASNQSQGRSQSQQGSDERKNDSAVHTAGVSQVMSDTAWYASDEAGAEAEAEAEGEWISTTHDRQSHRHRAHQSGGGGNGVVLQRQQKLRKAAESSFASSSSTRPHNKQTNKPPKQHARLRDKALAGSSPVRPSATTGPIKGPTAPPSAQRPSATLTVPRHVQCNDAPSASVPVYVQMLSRNSISTTTTAPTDFECDGDSSTDGGSSLTSEGLHSSGPNRDSSYPNNSFSLQQVGHEQGVCAAAGMAAQPPMAMLPMPVLPMCGVPIPAMLTMANGGTSGPGQTPAENVASRLALQQAYFQQQALMQQHMQHHMQQHMQQQISRQPVPAMAVQMQHMQQQMQRMQQMGPSPQGYLSPSVAVGEMQLSVPPVPPVHAGAAEAAAALPQGVKTAEQQLQQQSRPQQQPRQASPLQFAGLLRSVSTDSASVSSAKMSKQTEEQWIVAIQAQIEYYFSERNLASDFYLRGKMDSGGFVPLREICGFRRLKQMHANPRTIIRAAQRSRQLEVSTPAAAGGSDAEALVDPEEALIRCSDNPTKWVIVSQTE